MASPGDPSSRPRRRIRPSAFGCLALVLAGSLLAPGIAAAQDADGTWASPFEHPESRRLHNAVYDPLHQRLIVFGGTMHSFDRIWTLSLGDRPEWSSHRVSGPIPVHRIGASAIFDTVRDRVIFYEGTEVWSLSLSGVPAWTLLVTGGPMPLARRWHTAVYDSKRDRMIVFGGDHTGTALGDVWTLDLSNGLTWEQLVVPTPSFMPRRQHAATYDPEHDRMLIFGGEGFNYRTDTWELRLSGVAGWREIASSGPPVRVGASLLYDPVHDRAVLLGGWGTVGNGRWMAMDDVWALPANTEQWSQVGSHLYLAYAASGGFNDRAPSIYDVAHRRVVAYGGTDAMMIPIIDLNETQPRNSWLLPRPWPRSGQSAMFDPKRDRMIMSLGGTQDGWIDETWQLGLSGKPMWSVLPTGGTYERESQTAVLDPIGDRMIVFGGWGSNETWELPLETPTWNQLSPGGTVPELREGHSAIFDPRRQRMIVFGGVGHTGSRMDAFSLTLDGTLTWSPLPAGPPRAWHSAIHDPVGDRMLVFGGAANRWSAWSNEVWSLSLAEPMSWSQLAPDGDAPAARHQSAAIYDPIRHRVVVYGGCCFEDENYSTLVFGDTWELALDGPPRWRRMANVGSPRGLRAANLVYDAPRDRAILYGGIDAEYDFDRRHEAWALTWGNPARPTVSSPGDIVPGARLVLSYVVSNPLPGARAVEWTVSSDRAWPGFPHRGLQVVPGGSSETVRLELTLPDGSFEAPNELTFTAGFSGAPGHVTAARHTVWSRPDPPRALAIRLLGQGAGGRPRVEFTLRDASPARLELLDVAGRRLSTQHVGSLGPGTHALDLAEGATLRSGIYFVRLLQSGDEVHARAAVIR